MIDADLTVNNIDIIHEYEKVLSSAQDFVNDSAIRTMTRIEPEILQRLQLEPGPVARPIVWTSARQRRFVMAAIRRGDIQSPYQRTHLLSRSWKVIGYIQAGAPLVFTVTNDAPAFDYVEGVYQQGWHKTTGWLDAQVELPAIGTMITDNVTDDIIRAWYSVDEAI